MSKSGFTTILAFTLGAAACEGTFVVDPNDPVIDLTLAAREPAATPLVYVDGVVSSLNAIRELDRNRIASIEIVKGAAAVTLHGASARDGVIYVSLKP